MGPIFGNKKILPSVQIVTSLKNMYEYLCGCSEKVLFKQGLRYFTIFIIKLFFSQYFLLANNVTSQSLQQYKNYLPYKQIPMQEKGSDDEFEEFSQEFTTYSKLPQLSTTIKTPKKQPLINKEEQPKLRMIKQEIPKYQNDHNFLRREKRHISDNGKCIRVGDVLFKSNFQSGNLRSVTKIVKNIYEIQLERQVNSERVSSWFYFSCEGIKGEAKFIIKGFTKRSSLYNEGMKVCYKQVHHDNKWRRGGSNISYSKSTEEEDDQTNCHELAFTFFFKSQQPNTVEFAYCFPYTYTQLLQFISLNSNKMKIDILGKTYEDRQIPLLTIGNENSSQAIVISGRVHPGETVGSLMMEGFIKELLDDNQYSKNLRESFVFKIVPMINPDGVIHGNYRFSAAGYDLNRKWKSCKKKYHPQIYYLKEMISTLKMSKQIMMFIDMHGHSRQKNVFFYGCCPKSTEQDTQPNYKPKEFPYLMSKLHPPFRYDHCSFKVQKSKQGTARIVVWKQLKIDYVYTLESTFCGCDGKGNFLQTDYQKLGSKLCKGICLQFWNIIMKKINFNKNSKIGDELKKNMNEFYDNPSIARMDYEGNQSDSEPEEGQIPEDKKDQLKKTSTLQPFYSKTSKLSKLKNEIKPIEFDHQGYKRSRLMKTQNESKDSFQKGKKPGVQIRPFARIQERIQSNKNKIKSIESDYDSLMNKTLKEKSYLSKEVIHLQNGFKNVSQSYQDKYRSQQLDVHNLRKDMKRKVNEGIHYRRVRKLAQEHNHRHYDKNMGEGGLSGNNTMVEASRINSFKNRQAESLQNKKNYFKKKSVDMYFRRQIKASDYSNNKKWLNQISAVVKCEGKQIHS